MHARRSLLCTSVFAAATLLAVTTAPAQQGGTAFLVKQDFSDCKNGNVDPNPLEPGGEVVVARNTDGTTSVKVGMTVRPKTTYHFFLKCVRILGDITTDDDGVGIGVFTFRTNETDNVITFDMYPEGAPAGNKYQSVPIRF
jgi:hypothetical protein